MQLSEVVIAALATWQVVEIWRHSSLFANWRATVETWEGKLGALLACAFCLSVSVGFIAGLTSQIPYLRFLVYGFAVSRLANLGNDLTHAWCRTPKFDALPKTPFENEDHD